MTRHVALLALALLAAPGVALAGEGATVTYYGGYCPEEGTLLCDFLPWSSLAYIRVADSLVGPVCYQLQIVYPGSSYSYAYGFGSGIHTVPPGASYINVYVGNLQPATCALEGRVSPATTGSITVEWR